MKFDIDKNNRKNSYMKMMQVIDCWLFQTKVLNICFEVKVNMNDLWLYPVLLKKVQVVTHQATDY